MGWRRQAVVWVAVWAVTSAALAQQNASVTERSLFESVNRDRKAKGLPALKWDEALATAARKHAEEMARQNSVAHTLPGEPSLPARDGQSFVVEDFSKAK